MIRREKRRNKATKMNYQVTGNEYVSPPALRASNGVAEGFVRIVRDAHGQLRRGDERKRAFQPIGAVEGAAVNDAHAVHERSSFQAPAQSAGVFLAFRARAACVFPLFMVCCIR